LIQHSCTSTSQAKENTFERVEVGWYLKRYRKTERETMEEIIDHAVKPVRLIGF
jgi:hypothetical protein